MTGETHAARYLIRGGRIYDANVLDRLPPAFVVSRSAVASPVRTRPAIMSPSNPWPSISSFLVMPLGRLARSSSARRRIGLRPLRGGAAIWTPCADVRSLPLLTFW
jgi:hypothetical protein